MGRISKPVPVNAEQVRLALSGAGFTMRRDDAAGTVDIEAPSMSDAALTAALNGLVHDPAVRTNEQQIRDSAGQALAGNRTYIGLASPSAAQTAAQVKALSRQMNGLIRLVLGQLDGTD